MNIFFTPYSYLTMKTIGITGGTGFVGQHLTTLLIRNGYKVVIFTTRTKNLPPTQNLSYALWNYERKIIDENALQSVDGFVHLAGAGIADKRWTAERKKEIVESRVAGTDFIVSSIKTHAPRCKTFIATSATGFYGEDEVDKIPFQETAHPATDFLGNTCRQWEDASQKAADLARLVILRFGIVLGREHGAYPAFAGPLSFGVKPILGSGLQIISWITVEDLSRLILFAIENPGMEGIYNAVAPAPVSYKVLINTIAKKKGGLHIPVAAPAFLLKLVLGEMSVEVLKSCTVSAEKTVATGFRFENADIESAVAAIEK